MDLASIEEEIQKLKQTIEKTEKTKTDKESFKQMILEESQKFLIDLEKLKRK